jgi:hypothetical protein
MHHEELLSALIGDIYNAATDPSLWTDVLAKAARFVGGPSAALFSKNASGRAGKLVYEHGIEPRYRRLYLDQYIKLDPARTGHYCATGAATTRRIFAEVEQPGVGATAGPGRFRRLRARQHRDECGRVRRVSP